MVKMNLDKKLGKEYPISEIKYIAKDDTVHFEFYDDLLKAPCKGSSIMPNSVRAELAKANIAPLEDFVITRIKYFIDDVNCQLP